MVLMRRCVLGLLIGTLVGCETLVKPGSPGVVPVGSKQPVVIPEQQSLPEKQSAIVTRERAEVTSPQPFGESPAPKPVVKDHTATRLPVVNQLLTQCWTLMGQGNWPAAQQRIEQALRLAPQDPETFLVYGDWYAQQEQNDGAREMYQRARALAGKGTREAQSATEKLEQLTWR